MSVNKFKAGDKVKVRKGLVADEYYDGVYCNGSMAKMGGRVLTIGCIEGDRCYRVKERTFYWSDEMLEPVEKTLDNLVVGDFITSHIGESDRTVKILASLEGCYLISCAEDYASVSLWCTAAELYRLGYRPVKPADPEPTIEIEGKKYKKADVENAIRDLEPIQ
jgi:hypothetical protein